MSNPQMGKWVNGQMGEYPANWDEIATRVKTAAGWRCEHCNHLHEFPGWVLTVHHLDMDPANCAPENLVALCQRCHLHWQARFVPGQLMMAFALPDWLVRRGHGRVRQT